MINRLGIGLVIILLMAACARDLDPDPVRVRVLAHAERCIVNAQEMGCVSVGGYLRDTLQIPFDRPISVFVDGLAQSEARAKRVRDLLRSTGYVQVVSVGFTTEPHKD